MVTFRELPKLLDISAWQAMTAAKMLLAAIGMKGTPVFPPHCRDRVVFVRIVFLYLLLPC